MNQYRGIATFEDDQFPLTVGLDGERLSLVSGDVSIGEWPAGEYVVIDLGEGTFVIEAEKSSIPFQPEDPREFARGLGSEAPTASRRSVPMETVQVPEGPPPKPATLAAFYTLAAITLALAIWAVISLL
jgi:hypothetical protein